MKETKPKFPVYMKPGANEGTTILGTQPRKSVELKVIHVIKMGPWSH